MDGNEISDLEIEVTDEELQFDPSTPVSGFQIYHPQNIFTIPLKRKDTLNMRAGIEYKLSSTVALRAGFASLQGGVEGGQVSPVSLSIDRSVISLGCGYEGALFSLWSNEKISELSFDVYARYIMGAQQESALFGQNLVFDSDFLVVGIGVGLNIF